MEGGEEEEDGEKSEEGGWMARDVNDAERLEEDEVDEEGATS